MDENITEDDRSGSRVPDVLAAEALLASFTALRTGGAEAALFWVRFAEADRETLRGLLAMADAAIHFGAGGQDLAEVTLRRQLRGAICSFVAATEAGAVQ